MRNKILILIFASTWANVLELVLPKTCSYVYQWWFIGYYSDLNMCHIIWPIIIWYDWDAKLTIDTNMSETPRFLIQDLYKYIDKNTNIFQMRQLRQSSCNYEIFNLLLLFWYSYGKNFTNLVWQKHAVSVTVLLTLKYLLNK